MKFKRHGRHQGDSDVDPGPGHYIALDDWGAAQREHDRTLYAFEKAALDEFRARRKGTHVVRLKNSP